MFLAVRGTTTATSDVTVMWHLKGNLKAIKIFFAFMIMWMESEVYCIVWDYFVIEQIIYPWKVICFQKTKQAKYGLFILLLMLSI